MIDSSCIPLGYWLRQGTPFRHSCHKGGSVPSLAQVEQVIRLEEAAISTYWSCCLTEKRRGGWVVFTNSLQSSELGPLVQVVELGKCSD